MFRTVPYGAAIRNLVVQQSDGDDGKLRMDTRSIRRSPADSSELQRPHLEHADGITPENRLEQSDIRIEVVPRASGSAAGQSENRLHDSHQLARTFAPIVTGAVKPSFAQRHPVLAKLFGAFVAVLAFPVLLAVNAVVTPFLMGAAFFSKAYGSGELAKEIGASTIAKALWGQLADDIARGDAVTWGMGFVAFVPGLVTFPAVVASMSVYEKLSGVPAREPLDIQSDIKACASLNDTVQRWVSEWPQRERAGIDTRKWAEWAEDSTRNAWTGPLSAVLEKLHQGAPTSLRGEIDPVFSSRLKSVLKVIQNDPDPFVPYLSTLGLSGLGTCRDRPVLSFLDLELRTQAYQTLADIKAGKKSLQDMLDLAVKRLVFDETFEKLASAMQLTRSRDPIEATLKTWHVLQEQRRLDIPALPYRLYGTDLSQDQMANVANQVTAVVTQRRQDRDAIIEFLARDDSPVPWKEASGSSPAGETQMCLEELKKREDALEVPEQGDQDWDSYADSAPYKKYLNDLKEIMDERNRVEGANIRYDGTQDRWLLA